VSPYDFPGLVSGLIGSQLVLWGVVFVVLSGLRALLVRGQPGRGHLARGILVGSFLLVLGGAAVLALAELTDQQRLLDGIGAPFLAGVAVVGAVALAVRGARRKVVADAGPEGGAPLDGGGPPAPPG